MPLVDSSHRAGPSTIVPHTLEPSQNKKLSFWARVCPACFRQSSKAVVESSKGADAPPAASVVDTEPSRERPAEQSTQQTTAPRLDSSSDSAIHQEKYQQLSSSKNTLESYYTRTIQGLRADIQPGMATVMNDIKALPLIIASENAGKPGLDLNHAGSPREFVQQLKILPDSCHKRFIVRMGAGFHHAAFDVYKEQGKLSIIGFDSVSSDPDQEFSVDYMGSLHSLLERELPNAEFTSVMSDSQRSPADCVVFGLSNASKMHSLKNYLIGLHKAQLEEAVIDGGDHGAIKLPMKKVRAETIFPSKVLAAFSKHNQSETQISKLIESHPEIKDIKVNKLDETLQSRQKRFIVTRRPPEDPEHALTYSNSIELKRIQYIKRAIEHINELIRAG